jgi:hypothetical protein
MLYPSFTALQSSMRIGNPRSYWILSIFPDVLAATASLAAVFVRRVTMCGYARSFHCGFQMNVAPFLRKKHKRLT